MRKDKIQGLGLCTTLFLSMIIPLVIPTICAAEVSADSKPNCGCEDVFFSSH